MAYSLGAMSAVFCPIASELVHRSINGKLSSFVQVSTRSPCPNLNRLCAVFGDGGAGDLKQQLRTRAFRPLDGYAAPHSSFGDQSGGSFAWRKTWSGVCSALASDGDVEPRVIAQVNEDEFLSKKSLLTGAFFLAWYILNVVFNILNKKILNLFPYPYFISVVHLAVGVSYCFVSWTAGALKRPPLSKELFLMLVPVSMCHAFGHVMSNVSYQSVAVSFTHTVKALEPFFNASASQFILGQSIPLPLWLSLAPIVLGVVAASLTEISFTWRGFISALFSNLAFTYRNIYAKKGMTDMDSTNLWAYISIMALAICIPPAIVIEGPALLSHGFKDVIAKVGLQKFVFDLFWVGMFYHLYNQTASNTLERVAPLSHAVGNVLKRVFVIGFSIVVFGNRISTQTGIGTAVAIAGVAVYSLLKADIDEKKRKEKLNGADIDEQKHGPETPSN